MEQFYPEGRLIRTEKNREWISSPERLEEAFRRGVTLEAPAAMCSIQHDIIVSLPFGKGIIPREEGDLSVCDDPAKDIALLTRVGKEVCFKITDIIRDEEDTVYVLSRRAAQKECMEEYISKLAPGDVIPARVTHLEQFGAFVDIGCGITSMIPIDAISVSRISHPSDRFGKGQDIFAVVKALDESRVYLSHKELLGTWEENAGLFQVGETVSGIVRSVESYGIFVELTPNLAGLAELKADVLPGQAASVYIKAIIPDKMKIKLIIVDSFPAEAVHGAPDYFIASGRIDRWVYSTDGSEKEIISEF